MAGTTADPHVRTPSRNDPWYAAVGMTHAGQSFLTNQRSVLPMPKTPLMDRLHRMRTAAARPRTGCVGANLIRSYQRRIRCCIHGCALCPCRWRLSCSCSCSPPRPGSARPRSLSRFGSGTSSPDPRAKRSKRSIAAFMEANPDIIIEREVFDRADAARRQMSRSAPAPGRTSSITPLAPATLECWPTPG